MVKPVRLAHIAESSSELALSNTQIKNHILICFTPIPGLQQPQILYKPNPQSQRRSQTTITHRESSNKFVQTIKQNNENIDAQRHSIVMTKNIMSTR